MDSQRRSRYLRALDIGTWTRPVSGDDAAIAETASLQTAHPSSPPARTAAALATRAQNPKFHERPVSTADAAAAAVLPPVTPVVPREVPKDWTALQETVAGCTACKLCRTRNRTVFGVGAESSPLMVIGEGPGADEDAQGFPFVGKAGKLLDEMLKAIGRARIAEDAKNAVYIANVVKCRPPQNRDPEKDEVEACRPYLDAQIEHVKPKLIVALGRIAAQRLLSTDQPLSKLRGPQHEYGERRTPVLVSYHPAYLLRSPGEKAKSWEDLKRVQRFLRET